MAFGQHFPEGMTTAEMWQVFAILMEEIIDEDHLIVDISNSFRSLPVMVLAALGFLQEVRNIRIDRLVYGAYDRNAGMRTAMMNLQPFVELTTWVNATHSLLHYGQGAELASLMRRITTKKRNPWLRLAVTLSDLNAALQLVQLTGVSALANQLREQVDTLPQELDEQYLPIKQLLNRVADSYAEFQPAIMMRDELLRQQRIIR